MVQDSTRQLPTRPWHSCFPRGNFDVRDEGGWHGRLETGVVKDPVRYGRGDGGHTSVRLGRYT